MVNDDGRSTERQLKGRALAIGAHPDDVEFGCFGSLQRFEHRHVLVLTTGESGGPAEIRGEEAAEAAAVIDAQVKILTMPDTALSIADAIPAIREAVHWVEPDVVFTTSVHDGHQDHANLGSAVRSALRQFEGMVLAYVTPSATESFAPTAFFRLSNEEFDQKLRAIEAHKTQLGRPYLAQRAIEAYARYWAALLGNRLRVVRTLRSGPPVQEVTGYPVRRCPGKEFHEMGGWLHRSNPRRRLAEGFAPNWSRSGSNPRALHQVPTAD